MLSPIAPARAKGRGSREHDPNDLSDIETNRKPGSARALQRLAKALRVDMDELVVQPPS